MKKGKMILLSLLCALLLFASFSFLFVALDLFPYKYQVVEATNQQLTLETGILSNEKTFTLAESGLNTAGFELQTERIMEGLSRIDVILYGISLALTVFLLNLATFFYTKRAGEKHANYLLLSSGALALLFVTFILQYRNELLLIELNMRF